MFKHTHVQSLHLSAFSYSVYENLFHVPQMNAPCNPLYMELHSMKDPFLNRYNINMPSWSTPNFLVICLNLDICLNLIFLTI